MKGKKPADPAESEEAKMLRDQLKKVVEVQLKENDPPETKQALERLLKLGHDQEEAMRHILIALTIEVFATMQGGNHDDERYARNLNALPELPVEMQE